MSASPSDQPGDFAAQRVVSLDALRGFDMFWIIGGATIIEALQKFGDATWIVALGEQMEHVQWEGFHFEDLIFPLFVFISGASLVFALTRHIETHGRGSATRRLIVRAILLFLLGVLYSGGLDRGWDQVRWMGVLQRIAIAYLGAGLLFVWCKPRTLVVACLAILIGYWALLTFVPVPGVGPAHFGEGQNLTNYLDRHYLAGRKYDGDHDPEGLLSNLPAIATCLLGVFSGLWLRGTATAQRKAAVLVGAGVLLLAAGWLWGGTFPVIKKLWTSSYVLVAGGWSAILLGTFHYLISERGWRRGFIPFIWIGLNPITLYLLANVIDFPKLAQRLAGGDLKEFLNTRLHAGVGDMLLALVTCGLILLVAGFLYRRRIFLRV